MLSPWVGAGAALDGRRLFDLEDARKIVMSREEKANERFAHALARAPRLADVIPQVEGVDSAWRVVKSTLAAPSWNPKLRVPLTTLDAKPPAPGDTVAITIALLVQPVAVTGDVAIQARMKRGRAG